MLSIEMVFFNFIENIPAITSRGGLKVVREITEMGYDCRMIESPVYNVPVDEKESELKIGHINIVFAKDQTLILPEPDGKCFFVHILYADGTPSGKIRSNTNYISLGIEKSKLVESCIDSQPTFLYVPQKKDWHILSLSSFVFYPIEVETPKKSKWFRS